MPKKIQFISGLLFLMIGTPIAAPLHQAQAERNLYAVATRQLQRNGFINFETIIDSLGIAPGMTILDIGSSAGLASFLFAERLHGSGAVFATEIREDIVNYVADEAKKRGLVNLHPVVVTKDGLDDFYGTQRYDLVFLSNVYHCLDNRIEYFRKLRGFLKPNARLVLILYNQTPLFTEDELSDLDGLADSLARETDDNPFIKRLSTTSKQLLKGRDKAGSGTGELKGALVEDFNRMLLDPRFYKHFYRDSYFTRGLFTPPERDFANWLLMSLHEDGIFDIPAGQMDAKSLRKVIKLNRLFFEKNFGGYLAHDHAGIGAYAPSGDANRHTSKYVMLRELGSAGYGFAKEIRLSPYFDAVIMAPRMP